tara:strand:+ start:4028 stop:6436 length:2409 start_codon:yes stop_codon:yes gene_type:complete
MGDLSTGNRWSYADHTTGWALFGILYLIYWLTTSLTFISADELFLFDTAESFARRGSVMRNMTADLDWPGHTYVEPVQPLLSIPLILFADIVSDVGVAHSVLLLNMAVTAATGTLLFLYVRWLGYRRNIAIAAALLFGLTTIAWPYSKNYFREAIAGFTLLLAAYGLLRWRYELHSSTGWSHRWMVLAIVSSVLSVMAKESGVVGLPMLVLIPLIGKTNFRKTIFLSWQLALIVSILVAMAFAGLYIYTELLGAGTFRFQFFERLSGAFANINNSGVGIAGFLFSPGKGFFWHSPVLILALLSPFLSRNRRRLDVIWPLFMFITFVVVYALVRGDIWFGGTNWGPRYLVPVTPFMMLAVLPTLEHCLNARLSNRLLYTLVFLAILGFLVQIGAVWINPLDYYAILNNTGIPGAAWTIGLWSLSFSPILGHWRMIVEGTLPDFAWAQHSLDGPDWILAIVLLASVAGIVWLLYRVASMEVSRVFASFVSFLVVISVVLLTLWGMRRVYFDQRYQGDHSDLHVMRTEVENTVLPDPVIFLNNRTYFDHMLNFYKGDSIWYTLELNPNELIDNNKNIPSPNTDPVDLLHRDAWSPVDYFGRQHQTMILVMETGAYHSNVVRTMEWWMNSEFHAIQKRDYAPDVRTISFSSVTSPARDVVPEFWLGVFLGEDILLRGYDANPPPGLVRPSNILNLSIQWEALQDISERYTIGTYLISPQGTVELQNDSEPVGGFWPTQHWTAGDIIRHNVAFVLPDDLPPGHYAVWAVMYSAVDGSRLPVSDETATAIRDHVELYTIEVARIGLGG